MWLWICCIRESRDLLASARRCCCWRGRELARHGLGPSTTNGLPHHGQGDKWAGSKQKMNVATSRATAKDRVGQCPAGQGVVWWKSGPNRWQPAFGPSFLFPPYLGWQSNHLGTSEIIEWFWIPSHSPNDRNKNVWQFTRQIRRCERIIAF